MKSCNKLLYIVKSNCHSIRHNKPLFCLSIMFPLSPPPPTHTFCFSWLSPTHTQRTINPKEESFSMCCFSSCSSINSKQAQFCIELMLSWENMDTSSLQMDVFIQYLFSCVFFPPFIICFVYLVLRFDTGSETSVVAVLWRAGHFKERKTELSLAVIFLFFSSFIFLF